ncbi:molybdate ABC transporter permease subunit [Eubacterium barkeri]|uniref:Molybdenum transport system permease n=1 Tax=Eubacterium barkeri TaxID=1528 RepID=A0A1H3FP85_EUBBA|nr:molybdate ABC transporter permease subunit [Eubacterium barkeri]SDX92720.1 molybdate transport system permease protein [Eubacterium barkeri]
MDWSPLFLSLKTAFIATGLTFLLGTLAAWKVVGLKRGSGLFDALFTLPLVLPPTVVGFFLLVLFGKNSGVGVWLSQVGIQVVFTWLGTVVASTVVAFPLMYRTARGAFEQMDETLIYAGQTLGLSDIRIFWQIVFPSCLPGIVGGTILAFARALGEFGATIMLAGNIPGKTQTVAVAVYSAVQNGNRTLAYKWVAVIVTISVISILGMNWVNGRQRRLDGRRS